MKNVRREGERESIVEWRERERERELELLCSFSAAVLSRFFVISSKSLSTSSLPVNCQTEHKVSATIHRHPFRTIQAFLISSRKDSFELSDAKYSMIKRFTEKKGSNSTNFCWYCIRNSPCIEMSAEKS